MSEIVTTIGTLRCSLNAYKSINSAFNGFMNAEEALNRLDADAIETIVGVGLEKSRDEIAGAVFEVGMPALVPLLRDYLNLLVNGGRKFVPPAKPGEKESQIDG